MDDWIAGLYGLLQIKKAWKNITWKKSKMPILKSYLKSGIFAFL